jgi:hypothetical protein
MSGFGFKKPPLGQLWGFELRPIDARSTLVSHMMKWPLFPLNEVPLISQMARRGVEHELANMRPTLAKLAKLTSALIIGDLQVTYDWCLGEAPFDVATPFAATPAK